MQASDVISDVRSILAEPNPNGRWSDALLLGDLNIAIKELTRDIRFPESRGVFTTIAGVQEYALQEQLRILRVYYAGESLPRTDIPTMEGYQIQMYDNTAQGAGPGGLIEPGQPSPLLQTPCAPQWTSVPAQSAPVMEGMGTSFAQPYSQPWYPGRRPVYYLRGGNLGIVPAPAGAVTVVIDAIRQPASLTNTSQELMLPDICRQCLMWRTVFLCYASDRGEGAEVLRGIADKNYQSELLEVRHWSNTYSGTAQGVKVLTQRSVVGTRGNHRIGSGRG